MPYVCSRISDGMGNRFFQVAAALGYAEKHGHNPVFVREWMVETNHVSPRSIFDYFPTIQTIPLAHSWTLMEEPDGGGYSYFDLPRTDVNVQLKGYFQTEKYFPSAGVPRPAILIGLEDQYRDFAFLHVRRGDYLLSVCRHHYVDLATYYRYALALFADSDARILVCSDDIAWCRATLPARYGDLIPADRWAFLEEEASDYDTLRAMTACGRGGITANSTFSWWGAYWGVGRHNGAGVYAMPSVWGHPPLPPAVDIHPSWAMVLPT